MVQLRVVSACAVRRATIAWFAANTVLATLAMVAAPRAVFAQFPGEPGATRGPALWLMLSEGIGMTEAGPGYSATMVHLPHAALGMRVVDGKGIELGVTIAQSVFGNGDSALVYTRLVPPSYRAVTASFLTMRHSNRMAFTQLFGIGAGAYREAGQERVDLGFQAYLDSGFRPLRHSTLSTGLRLIFIPNTVAGRILTIGIGGVLRSR